jgi:ABC-type sugar transport system ATPase subunit
VVESTPAVEVRGITKAYPGVLALHDVSLAVQPGSCHALMGENGAGKSTLGKILAGLIAQDSGEIFLFGKPVKFRSPLEASRAGISIVHQELIAFDNLTVEENLLMEDMPSKGPFVAFGDMRKTATEWLLNVHARVDPSDRFGDLPTSLQQLVLIAGAVARGAKVVIFDEPTSSLSRRESEVLFEQIDRLKAAGVTCIYVSHRMDEIFRLCDHVSVLRDGHHVGTKATSELDRDQLVRMMIGRDIDSYTGTPAEVGEAMLEVENLSSPGRFSDVSFTVRKGEIVGFAGLVGSGRSEIATALFGLDHHSKGAVKVHGVPVTPKAPAQMMGHRVGLVPEDRKRQGLVLMMNARENITLPTLNEEAIAGWVNRKKERAVAASYFQKLRVKAPSTESSTLGLSGGNQQKLVLAKWLAAQCDVLILDEPTRGVDVGAKAEIHTLIREFAREGRAVIVISSELPEILSLSTRILVVAEGRIVGEADPKSATEESLLKMMSSTSRV